MGYPWLTTTCHSPEVVRSPNILTFTPQIEATSTHHRGCTSTLLLVPGSLKPLPLWNAPYLQRTYCTANYSAVLYARLDRHAVAHALAHNSSVAHTPWHLQ